MIFSEQEGQNIVNFMLRTFFRHFCLYEYSFKPKVDLILMTQPTETPNSANASKLTGGASVQEASI